MNGTSSSLAVPSMTGVVLMTYGSPTTKEHVRPFFTSIYGDTVREETLLEFEKRYAAISASPLIEITQRQASLLQEKLGGGYVVRAGMRHGEPSIKQAVRECKERGATRILGVILSPQYSKIIMGAYEILLREAGTLHAFQESEIRLAKPWPDESHFIASTASRITNALGELGENTPVIFTTHSMPKRVIDTDPGYLSQLQTTINALLNLLPRSLRWYAAYQSAGHTPEPWLKPDLVDILAILRDKKETQVLIVPIQFLADHLEVLYDLDIAAKMQCEDFHIEYNRITLPNTDSLLIEALSRIARNS